MLSSISLFRSPSVSSLESDDGDRRKREKKRQKKEYVQLSSKYI